MIGVLDHPMIARSQPLADEVCSWLNERGNSTWRCSIWAEDQLHARVEGSKMVIVLGGDGSILRAARASAEYGVPIFSINLGRVGFLSEASPDDWQQRLEQTLAGNYRLERRLMLRAHIVRQQQCIGVLTALNEVVVSRGRQARVVRFHLHVDDDHVTSYVADGVIVATPTGSTAYALAAGGPIMPPELPNFVVVPVAAHLSFNRSLVLYEDAVASLNVTFDHEATATADGQDSVDLESGDQIDIMRAPYSSHFIRVEDPSYFYKRLMASSGGLRPSYPD